MKTRKIVLTLFIAVALLFVKTLTREVSTTSSAESHIHLKRDTIKAAINIHKSIYDKNRFVVGFHYELLEKSMAGKNLSIKIAPEPTTTDYWGRLISGELDVIVTDDIKSIPEEILDEVYYSIPVGDNEIWVVKKESGDLLEYFNRWISYYANSSQYDEMYNRYFKKSPFSPYEFLIKEKSQKIGWDWRLLAAVIYQESRFTPHATSYRGAAGLMQIMPSTAKHYGMEDMLDPKANLEVGVRHLNRLQKQFLSEGMEKEEVIKFTLAAYNAGEGKISNCRELADEYGYDTSKWDEVSKVLPELMITEQTLSYVNSVIDKYEEYKLIAKR